MNSLIGALVFSMLFSIASVQTSAADKEYEDAKALYESLSAELSDYDDEIISSDEFIWGFVGSSIEEGRAGLVQYSFSRKGAYGFELPSGGTKIKTLEDIIYLESWTTSDKGTEEGLPKKGSLGVGSVQWSYERRLKYCEILKELISDPRHISDEELKMADIKMISYELSETYKETVTKELPDKPTERDCCDALCIKYFGITSEESREERCDNAEKFYSRYLSEKRARKIGPFYERAVA